MPLSTHRCIEAITEHSRALADCASATPLRRRVEHCPDWNVADLVWHVTEVHWLWRTVVAELLTEPPPPIRRPTRPGEDEVVDLFLLGADQLTQTLLAADQAAPCYTWYPPQQDVAFVTRHQVQEAVVHHFDAAHAAGVPISVAQDVAIDSVEEFLTTSLADADDAAHLREKSGLELGDDLVLHATDAEQDWTVYQAESGALLWEPGRPEGTDPTVAGTATQLLLWLYGRTEIRAAKPNLVNRFRRMSSTD